jgi:hypothetical protein
MLELQKAVAAAERRGSLEAGLRQAVSTPPVAAAVASTTSPSSAEEGPNGSQKSVRKSFEHFVPFYSLEQIKIIW